MGLKIALRNATKWLAYDYDRPDEGCAQAVALVDPVSGDAVSGEAPLPTSPLRKLGTPRNVAVGAASASQALTSGCTAISMTLLGCNARLKISTAGTAATSTDHRILDGERIDVAVEAGSTVAVIAESGTGTLAISELL